MSTRELQQLNSLPSIFDDFFRPWNDLPSRRMWTQMQNMPAANIVELPDRFKISLAAPGLKKEDFNIDVDDTMLTVSSEQEEKTESADQDYTLKEYNYSSFSRSFNLPEEVEPEKISARYENGVLELDLMKKDSAAKANLTRKITVN